MWLSETLSGQNLWFSVKQTESARLFIGPAEKNNLKILSGRSESVSLLSGTPRKYNIWRGRPF
jgi:hypothetical protein